SWWPQLPHSPCSLRCTQSCWGVPALALHLSILTTRRAFTMILRRFLIVLLFAAPAAAQTPVEVVSVISRAADRQVRLPGEFLPYLSVAIHAKVTGFVDKVEVDRRSDGKRGQLLATPVPPEMKAQLAEEIGRASCRERV